MVDRKQILQSELIIKFGQLYNTYGQNLTVKVAKYFLESKHSRVFNKNDEDVLFYAFRYALGRRTGAVSFMVDRLKENWDNLPPTTKEQIQGEIRKYNDLHGSLGGDCDIRAWQEILDLGLIK